MKRILKLLGTVLLMIVMSTGLAGADGQTESPKVTTQPSNRYVTAGATAKFTVAATGKATITYQWQYRRNSSATWTNSGQSGNRTATLSVAATDSLNGYQFRCVVTDGSSQKAYSNAATLITKPLFTVQPKDQYVLGGSTAKFSVAVLAKSTATYQWEYRKNTADEWKNSGQSGNKTATLSVSVTDGMNGYQFRCAVTDGNGKKEYSNPATLITRPTVKTQPKDQFAVGGSVAKFTVSVTAKPTISYQWQYRKNTSDTWKTSGQSGNKTATLSVSVTDGMNGYQFRCLVKDGNGKQVYSDPATLITKPIVNTQPKDQYVAGGSTAKFKVAVTGKATISYQWQYLKNSTDEWKNSGQSGNKSATLSVAATEGMSGYQFRCLIKDGNGKQVYSDSATLITKPIVNTQPKDQYVAVGSTAKFTVEVSAKATITYQWQYRRNTTDTWKNSGQGGNKTATLSVAVADSYNGYQFRCLITDGNGKQVYSGAASLCLIPKITAQPSDQYPAAGSTAKFAVAATGKGTLKYQWQYRKNASATWANTSQSGNKTATLSVTVNANIDGYQFRCAISDDNGHTAYSNAAMLTISPKITVQPSDKSAMVDTAAKFTVAATGTADVTYQWQYRKNSSDTWKDSRQSGNKTATLSVWVTGGFNGYQFRCAVTDGAGQTTYSAAAILTIIAGISTQPADQYAEIGSTTVFSVKASGLGELTYQWQYRTTKSTTWVNSSQSGATTATLSMTATTSLQGYKFRCVITDGNGTKMYSNAATLSLCNIPIEQPYFASSILRKYVSDNVDTDKNGILSAAEIKAVTSVDVHGKGLSSMKGIEFFTKLKYLDCSENKLTSLSLGANSLLTYLDCSFNNLSSLDITCCTRLQNPVFRSVAEAAAVLRGKMKARQNEIVIQYYADTCIDSVGLDLQELALVHTGDPTEGDYLRFNLVTFGISQTIDYNGEYYLVTLHYSITYRTTAAQEQEMNSVINDLVGRISAETSEAAIVLELNNYFCDNVSYDYNAYAAAMSGNITDQTPFSAYGALINHSAVCNGYALLFYRLALELGLDARIVSGIGETGGSQESHAWNIVRVNGSYYYVDATWNSTGERQQFLLLGGNSFPNHYPYDEDAQRVSSCKMATTDYPRGDASVVYTENGYQYTVYFGEATVVKYVGTSLNPVVPARLGGYPVRVIGKYAFSNIDIESLTFSEGIRELKPLCAYYCINLKTVTIPSTVRINAYYSENVFGIGEDPCIFDCPAVESYNVANGNPYIVSVNGVVFNKDKTILMYYPAGKQDAKYTIPDGVISIANYAFGYNVYVQEVVMPNTVRLIDYFSFFLCSSLEKINISENCRTIGEYAFTGTSLKQVHIPASVNAIVCPTFDHMSTLTSFTVDPGNTKYYAEDGILFSDHALICYPAAREGAEYTVGDDIQYLAWGAFHSNCYLEKVVLPYGIQTIPYEAFAGCNNLSSVTIPEGVVTIMEGAFMDCYALSTITFPESLRTIGGFIFANTIFFADLYYMGNIEQWNSVSIADNNDELLYARLHCCIGDSKVNWYFFTLSEVLQIEGYGAMPSLTTATQPWISSIKAVKTVFVREGVTQIGANAFNGASNMTAVSLPNGLTSIEANAFYGCSKLTDVYFAGSASEWAAIQIRSGNDKLSNATVHYLADYFVAGKCGDSLTWELSAEGTLTVRGNGVMWSYSSSKRPEWMKYFLYIKQVCISNGVTSIGSYAFYDLNFLTTIIFPDSVRSIGSGAFYKFDIERGPLPTSILVPNTGSIPSSIKDYDWIGDNRAVTYRASGN